MRSSATAPRVRAVAPVPGRLAGRSRSATACRCATPCGGWCPCAGRAPSLPRRGARPGRLASISFNAWASSADRSSPVSTRRLAAPKPMRRSAKCDAANSGTTPILTNRSENFACGAARIWSAGRIKDTPTPMAAPLTAATTGLLLRRSATHCSTLRLGAGLLLLFLAEAEDGRHVGTGTEALAGGREDDRIDVFVGVRRLDGAHQLGVHLVIPGVHLLGTAERDDEHAAIDGAGERLRGHFRTPPSELQPAVHRQRQIIAMPKITLGNGRVEKRHFSHFPFPIKGGHERDELPSAIKMATRAKVRMAQRNRRYL